MEFIKLISTSLLSIAVLFIIAKIMGHQQVALALTFLITSAGSL